jgi:hypothetical protein
MLLIYYIKFYIDLFKLKKIIKSRKLLINNIKDVNVSLTIIQMLN